MRETLVQIDGLSKKFCLSLRRSLWYGLSDIGSEVVGRRHGGGEGLRPEEFWALRNVNFELARGECLGLIGHNGAGKTTLLRVLNGLIKPDAGRIELRGRVGALIALGAGFNPILTGRENIYINASVLGLKKRHVDSKLEEIVEFAGIGPFLDMPVRNYSSGMNVRLGFSVAAILLEPDILLLDEVLAVGDVGFVVKCLNAMRSFAQRAAVVFVSHNMQHISSFCTRVLVMDHGTVLLNTADTADGIDRYYALSRTETQLFTAGEVELLTFALIVNGRALTGDEARIVQGAQVSAHVSFRVGRAHRAVQLFLYVQDETLAPIVCIPIHGEHEELWEVGPGEHSIEVALGSEDLNAGKYSVGINIRNPETSVSLLRGHGLASFRVTASRKEWGKVVRPAKAKRRDEWPSG